MESLVHYLITQVSILLMVFGGIGPFVPQYLKMRANRSTAGFSLFVCFTLIMAMILRIFFWIGKPFELPLLYQAIVILFMMFFLLKTCKDIEQANRPRQSPTHRLRDWDWKYFWQWSDFRSYINFCILFTAFFGLIFITFRHYPIFVDAVGLLALFMESLLGVPQAISNYQNKSTVGMSTVMVCLWFSGDTFKTAYFVLREAPAQFVVCGIFQIFLDIFILTQVAFYNYLLPRRTSS